MSVTLLREDLVVPKEPDPVSGWTTLNIFLKYEERKSTCWLHFYKGVNRIKSILLLLALRKEQNLSVNAGLLIHGWTSRPMRPVYHRFVTSPGEDTFARRLIQQLPLLQRRTGKTRPSTGHLGFIVIITQGKILCCGSSKGKTEVDADHHHQKAI